MSIGFSRWPAKPLVRSQATPPSSASALKATTGIADVRGPFASFRAASAPSMSGNRRSIKITSGRCSAQAQPRGAAVGLERPEPGGAQHVASELQVLLVVVDDEDERRGRHRRILVSGADPARARRGSLSRSRGGPAAARDTARTSRSPPSATTSTRCSSRLTQSGRTWS